MVCLWPHEHVRGSSDALGGLGVIDLLLRPPGVGTKGPEAPQSFDLATASEPPGTKLEFRSVQVHLCCIPTPREPFKSWHWRHQTPLSSNEDNTGNTPLNTCSDPAGNQCWTWPLKAFSCLSSVSHVKSQARRTPISASFRHRGVLREGDGCPWLDSGIPAVWESCCLMVWFCPRPAGNFPAKCSGRQLGSGTDLLQQETCRMGH